MTEKSEQKVELAACPFCGSPRVARLGRCIERNDCHASGPERTQRDECERAWNRRTPPPVAGEDGRDAALVDTCLITLVAFAEVLEIGDSSVANRKTFVDALISIRRNADRYLHVRKNPAMLLHLRNSEFDAAIDAAMLGEGNGN